MGGWSLVGTTWRDSISGFSGAIRVVDLVYTGNANGAWSARPAQIHA